MRPSLAAQAIEKCVTVQQPLFLWGPPGAGKSSIVKQIAKKLGVQLSDQRLSQMDPVDLRGIPTVDNVHNVMRFLPPDFLPSDPDSKGILFLDELNAAPPAIQAAAYQLVLDRRSGAYKLPDGWAVVAAGNRETDQGVTYTMAAPLANRFVHVDYDVHFEDWRAHAVANGFKSEVVNFISFRPGLLMAEDFDKRAFPTPRSWEFVSKILDSDNDSAVERALVAGAVGEGAAAEFWSFLKIFRNLPNPDLILMNPSKAEVPTDPATLYALCGALSERASEANFDRFVQYCERLKPEFQVLAIRDSVTRKRELASTGSFSQWAIKNASVLI